MCAFGKKNFVRNLAVAATQHHRRPLILLAALLVVGCGATPGPGPAVPRPRPSDAPTTQRAATADLAKALAAITLPTTIDSEYPLAWDRQVLAEPCGPVPLVVGPAWVQLGTERLDGLELLRQPRRIVERTETIMRQRLAHCQAVVAAPKPPDDPKDRLCIGCAYDEERPPLVVLVHAELDSRHLEPLLAYCAARFPYPLRVVLRRPEGGAALAHVDLRPRPVVVPGTEPCPEQPCPLGLTLELGRAGVFVVTRGGVVCEEGCRSGGPTIAWDQGRPSRTVLAKLNELLDVAKAQFPNGRRLQILWEEGTDFGTLAQVTSVAAGARRRDADTWSVRYPDVSWGVGSTRSVRSRGPAPEAQPAPRQGKAPRDRSR